MIREIVNLAVDGEGLDALIPDIEQIDVEEHVDSADVFRVRLSLRLLPDGTWSHVDDPRLAPWKKLSIGAGYPGDLHTLVDGYITHVNLVLSGHGADDSYLEISGMDASVRMDLEDRQLAWVNKKDSEIAQEIFASHGLSWEVEDTELQHREAITTILQAETDIRFLRRLAARNGFECHVQGTRGHFRSPDLQAPPQKLLALQFGAETNLNSLRLEVDATPPTQLEIRRVDPMEKQEERITLGQSTRRKLGKRPLATVRAGQRGTRLLRQQPATAAQEMSARLRAGYRVADEFVTAEGEIDGRSYGAVLRARRLVTIKGAGASHSGLYYVTRVRHLFTGDGYTQSFEATRNGLGVLGDEPFAAPTGLSALTSASAAAPVAGNRVLPAQQTGSTTPGGLRP